MTFKGFKCEGTFFSSKGDLHNILCPCGRCSCNEVWIAWWKCQSSWVSFTEGSRILTCTWFLVTCFNSKWILYHVNCVNYNDHDRFKSHKVHKTAKRVTLTHTHTHLLVWTQVHTQQRRRRLITTVGDNYSHSCKYTSIICHNHQVPFTRAKCLSLCVFVQVSHCIIEEQGPVPVLLPQGGTSFKRDNTCHHELLTSLMSLPFNIYWLGASLCTLVHSITRQAKSEWYTFN